MILDSSILRCFKIYGQCNPQGPRGSRGNTRHNHFDFFFSLHPLITKIDGLNEPQGAKGPPLVGEEVRKEYIGKVGIS